MGEFKVCASCEKTVDVDGGNTDKQPWAFSVSMCSKIMELTATDPSTAGGPDLPPVNGVKPSLKDLVVCKMCEESVRTELQLFCCSGCKTGSVVLCVGDYPKKEQDNMPEVVKTKWKCLSCYKQPEGMEIKWKCLKCFGKDSFCGSCKKPAENEDYVLRCSKCEQIYHYSCDEVALEKFLRMTSEEKSKWACKTCVRNKYKRIAIEVGKHAAITAGLSAVTLGGISLGIGALGFRTAGIGARTLAAWYQSNFLGGFIARGSLFSILQSVGVLGLGVTTKAGIIGVCSTLPLLTKIQWKSSSSKNSSTKKEKKE